MRTSPTVQKAEKYLDGSPVFKGDIRRAYTSQLEMSIVLSVVKAPEGAQVHAKADGELVQTMRKLKFGQIGAIKSNDTTEILGSEPALECIVPVDAANVLAAKDMLIASIDVDRIMSDLTCTVNQKLIKLKDLKDLLDKHRAENREIRKRWVGFISSAKARRLPSDVVKQEKASHYKDYWSVSEYAIAVQVTITHVVNNPMLKSTVKENIDQAYYDSVNYHETRVRKLAKLPLPIVSLPISTMVDYQKATSYVKELLKQNPNLKDLNKFGLEYVIHEGGIFGTNEINWSALKEHDKSVR